MSNTASFPPPAHAASPEVRAMGRCCYAPFADDYQRLEREGLAGWITAQIAPSGDDRDTAARLTDLRLRIRYPASDGTPGPNGEPRDWPATDEMRPLADLAAPIDQPWQRLDKNRKLADPEYRRPYDEVVAATILRAVHGRAQMREYLAGFWHDHFNVLAYGDHRVSAALPSYDREAIRPHVLGNFRDLLEAVAASPAMLIYLSNWTSRAGAANENYGRELLELHTLGRAGYLNDRYDRWREVPGALAGTPAGYIDQDVYEAARAFTGWSLEDGQKLDAATSLPRTGRFRYVENWHDGYQKRLLATDFDPFTPPLADGRKALDLAAFHPATARHLAEKLCRRLVTDQPSPALIDSTTALWIAEAKAPDQIAKVVRHIITAAASPAAGPAKSRNPLALMAAFARAAAIDLTPTAPLADQLAAGGQRLFGWPPPDGPPDSADYYLTASNLRQRWAILYGLAGNAWGNGAPALAGHPAHPRPADRGGFTDGLGATIRGAGRA